MSYSKHVAEYARLAILKELAQQTSGRLDAETLQRALEDWGHSRSLDFVKTQLQALAEVGAVRLAETQVAFVAEITRSGLDHVARRTVLAGVKKPLPEE